MGGGRAHEGRPPEHCSICSRQREPPWRRRPVAGPACEPRTGIPRAAAAAVAGEPADELGDSTPSLGSAGWQRCGRHADVRPAYPTNPLACFRGGLLEPARGWHRQPRTALGEGGGIALKTPAGVGAWAEPDAQQPAARSITAARSVVGHKDGICRCAWWESVGLHTRGA
jgi:hypothetical protein